MKYVSGLKEEIHHVYFKCYSVCFFFVGFFFLFLFLFLFFFYFCDDYCCCSCYYYYSLQFKSFGIKWFPPNHVYRQIHCIYVKELVPLKNRLFKRLQYFLSLFVVLVLHLTSYLKKSHNIFQILKRGFIYIKNTEHPNYLSSVHS